MSRGIIYVTTTTSVTGLIKIGKTQTSQFETRMATSEQNKKLTDIRKEIESIEIIP